MAIRRFPEGSVCKPCWELKYCPYGPLVEYFPLLSKDVDLDEKRRIYAEVLELIASGSLSTEDEIWDAFNRLMYLRPWMWERLVVYDVELMECNVWGHACPVFLCQSGATETKEARTSSRSIPRAVMLQVVRRDDYRCQICGEYVRDNELEFDHKIPFSMGGPTTPENLRVTHRSCNRTKSASVSEILR